MGTNDAKPPKWGAPWRMGQVSSTPRAEDRTLDEAEPAPSRGLFLTADVA